VLLPHTWHESGAVAASAARAVATPAARGCALASVWPRALRGSAYRRAAPRARRGFSGAFVTTAVAEMALRWRRAGGKSGLGWMMSWNYIAIAEQAMLADMTTARDCGMCGVNGRWLVEEEEHSGIDKRLQTPAYLARASSLAFLVFLRVALDFCVLASSLLGIGHRDGRGAIDRRWRTGENVAIAHAAHLNAHCQHICTRIAALPAPAVPARLAAFHLVRHISLSVCLAVYLCLAAHHCARASVTHHHTVCATVVCASLIDRLRAAHTLHATRNIARACLLPLHI